jgi:predicted solute-binding protein
MLKKASKKTNIPEKEILRYLTYISYTIDTKAKKSLKAFYTKVNF